MSGQDYIADVEFYGPENGLAGRYANCSYQDSRGIFWIGTQFGLSRFDGRNFLNFNENSGLPFNQIMQIHEDSEGWLWLFRNCQLKPNCIREITFFHSITHKVRTFEEHLGNDINLSVGDIESIVENENKDIFFSANKQVFQWSKGKIIKIYDFSHLDFTLNLITVIDDNKIAAWHHLKDKRKDSFVFYLVFDQKGKTIYSEKIPVFDKGRTNSSVRILGSNSVGEIIIGTRGQNGERDKHQFVILKNGTLSEIIQNTLEFSSNQFDKKSPFLPQNWFDNNLFKKDKRTEDFNLRLAAPFLELSRQKTIRQFRFYKNDITWACGRDGVFRYQIRSSDFNRILCEPYSQNANSLKKIARGIIPLPDSNFLLTTNQDIYLFDTQREKLIKKTSENAPKAPFTFTKDLSGTLWGFREGSIFKISSDSKNFQLKIYGAENKKNAPNVLSQYYENNRLWCGTDRGLYCFESAKNQWFSLTKYNEFEELKTLLISSIHKGNDGRIWLCSSGGLYLFSPEKGILERYWTGGVGKFKLPADYIYQMQPARKGDWWLATRQGLIFWNPNENDIKQFTTVEGLITNEILAVHEDNFGFVWLATNVGLIQFRIETEQLKVWNEADGISSVDFEPHSFFVQKNGTVWLGTTNGFTVFNPKDFRNIDLNTRPEVPLNILDFEQYSTETRQLENRTQELLKNQKITLNPGEKLFNLRLALADYVNGANTTYAYRIKGIIEPWQEGKENLIRISGLPYGKHELEIRGRLAAGQYSAQEINIPISVLRPFYLQKWFLIVSFGLSIGAIYFAFLWRIKRLKDRQSELEFQVKERTEVIEKQSEDLLELDKLKSRFFANVSHELRTPLTLMLGPTESVMNRQYLEEKDKKLLRYVYKNEAHLLGLINEILDLSKLENNRIEVKEELINLNDFLTHLIVQFKSYGDSEDIKFLFENEVPKNYQIYLDSGKTEKIINNFLSNAMKFSPKRGAVILKLEERNDCILISVKDSGQGIHSEDLPYIFDRFYQSKQPDALVQSGTGIGLSFSKELATLLDGRVWAESELGKGSTFYLEFSKNKTSIRASEIEESKQTVIEPIPIEIENVEIIKERPESSSTKPTVLIVEDNADLRGYLKILLDETYEVITAENGKIALDILSQKPVDLIISDLMMPVMNGFKLLETVKSKDQLRHLPVVMLTARADEKVKLNALRIGVDDYIIKPFREEELLVRIANLLKNYAERISFHKANFKEPSKKLIPESFISEEETQWLNSVEKTVLKFLDDYRLNIDFLVENLNVSRSTFKRKIKQLTGLTPIEYLKEIRFNKARELMETRAVNSVKAAAGKVGMKDVKYFSQQFKKRFGKSPSAYF